MLTGSTRMKSGTAEKLVLNMLTTASMIRIGKTYQNLMVDLNVSNEKLVARAARIVMQATGCTLDDARAALDKTGNDVKLAILITMTGMNVAEARERPDRRRRISAASDRGRRLRHEDGRRRFVSCDELKPREGSMTRKRAKTHLVGIAVAAVLGISALAAPADAETLRMAWAQDATGLDPHKQTAFSSLRLLELIYEPLVRLDANLQIVPGIATVWEILAGRQGR